MKRTCAEKAKWKSFRFENIALQQRQRWSTNMCSQVLPTDMLVGRGTLLRLSWSLKVLTNRHWHPSMGLRTWEEWRLRQIKKSEADENFADKCEKRHFWISSNRKMWVWSFWCCCEVAATKRMTLASALPSEAITAATYLNLAPSTFTLLAKLRGRVFHDYLNIWYSFQNIGIIAYLSFICRASQYFVGHKGRGKVW